MKSNKELFKQGVGYKILTQIEEYYSRDYEMRGPSEYSGSKTNYYLQIGEYEFHLGGVGMYGLDTHESIKNKLTPSAIKSFVNRVLKADSINERKLQTEINSKKLELSKLKDENKSFKNLANKILVSK